MSKKIGGGEKVPFDEGKIEKHSEQRSSVWKGRSVKFPSQNASTKFKELPSQPKKTEQIERKVVDVTKKQGNLKSLILKIFNAIKGFFANKASQQSLPIPSQVSKKEKIAPAEDSTVLKSEGKKEKISTRLLNDPTSLFQNLEKATLRQKKEVLQNLREQLYHELSAQASSSNISLLLESLSEQLGMSTGKDFIENFNAIKKEGEKKLVQNKSKKKSNESLKREQKEKIIQNEMSIRHNEASIEGKNKEFEQNLESTISKQEKEEIDLDARISNLDKQIREKKQEQEESLNRITFLERILAGEVKSRFGRTRTLSPKEQEELSFLKDKIQPGRTDLLELEKKSSHLKTEKSVLYSKYQNIKFALYMELTREVNNAQDNIASLKLEMQLLEEGINDHDRKLNELEKFSSEINSSIRNIDYELLRGFNFEPIIRSIVYEEALSSSQYLNEEVTEPLKFVWNYVQENRNSIKDRVREILTERGLPIPEDRQLTKLINNSIIAKH